MKIISLRQRSKEWIDWRRKMIMASDAPAIMGESKFKTIEKLYDEKRKGYEIPPNVYMQRGIELEPIALREFENETGLIMFPCVGVHKELDWMAASFDGMTLERDSFVEIKCSGKKDHAEVMRGNVPLHYRAQIQHQIHVSGLDFAYYFSFDGEKGITIEVKREDEFIEKMVEKELEFLRTIQAQQHKIREESLEANKYSRQDEKE